jgi:hypothetical protein
MRLSLRLFQAGLGLALACGQASAQSIQQATHGTNCPAPIEVAPQPYCPQGPVPLPQAPAPSAPPTTPQPQAPAQPTPPETPQLPPDVNFETARAGAGLGESFALAPQMMGDFGGISSARTIVVPINSPLALLASQRASLSSSQSSSSCGYGIQSTSSSSSVRIPPGFTQITVTDLVAVRAGSSFKIGDNATALPEDRVTFSYNYFDNLSGTNPGGANLVGLKADLHDEVFGLEKTFLDGNGSVGFRLPFFEPDGTYADASNIGDLSLILKYAVLNNHATGNVLSTGLVLTVPTGPSIQTIDGKINDTLIQPYVGYLVHGGAFFIQGFSSLVIPTDPKDITILFNDLEIGYTLYRGNGHETIRSISPVLEGHLVTPLSNRTSMNSSQVFLPDILDFTAGVHVGLGERLLFSTGVNFPVTGPKPYDVEVLAQLSYQF